MKKAITFRLKDEEFGLFSEEIREIVYAPKLFPVPKAPPYVKGVGNLRGNVLPIVDLKKLLFGEDSAVDEDTKVIVLSKKDGDAGLVVDDVKEVMDVDEEGLQRMGLDEMIKGVYESSGRLIQFLELDFLFSSQQEKAQTKSVERTEKKATTKEEESEIVLLFKVGDGDYCLSIDDVREIIDRPEELTDVPGAPDFILGIYSLRGTVIPVVSLSKLLGIDSQNGSRVIVARVGKTYAGLLVDQAREVYRVPKSSIGPPPPGFGEEEKRFIKGIVKIGKRLVLYLDPESLVPAGLEEYVEMEGEKEGGEVMGDVRMFINFFVGDNMMAFPIEKVAEVVDVSDIVHVPRSPDYVEGVMNLRGDVLPVISLAKRLDVESSQRGERIIVVNTDYGKVGFLVDKVKGIIRIDENLLFPPDGIPNFREEFLEAVSRLDTGELVLILNPEKLISEELEVSDEEDKGAGG